MGPNPELLGRDLGLIQTNLKSRLHKVFTKSVRAVQCSMYDLPAEFFYLPNPDILH